MSSLLLILLSAVLVNIAVLTGAPRWRPFAALSGIFPATRVIALLCLIAVPAATAITWLLSAALLEPEGLGYLRTPVFAATVLIIALLLEGTLHRDGRLLPQRPGFALLMSGNAAILGVALIADSRSHRFVDAMLFAAAGAAALAALLLTFAAMQERLSYADTPFVFRDAPLALITTGIMALAFMGFTGLVPE